jgi:hypothetical protein
MSGPKMTLPSGGGAYTRLADGSLRLDEPPTAPEAPGPASETAVEAPFQPPVKRTRKEA